MNDMILILNYSDEFAVEAARRLRGEQVFCKIISGMTTAAQIAQAAPRGIVLCGEPQSAAGVFDAEILKLGIPVLALGHAAHMLITAMGGACAGTWTAWVIAVEYARQAASMEPGNMQYQQLLSQLQGGGSWYSQQGQEYGRRTGGMNSVCTTFMLLNLCCACCGGGRMMYAPLFCCI